MKALRFFLPRRLAAKILAVLITVVVLQFFEAGYLGYKFLWRSVAETTQQRMFGIADDIAREMTPHLSPGPDRAVDYYGLRTTVFEFQRYNPDLDVYLLDRSGRVIGNFSRDSFVAKPQIDLEPIHRFLADPNRAAGDTILGENPAVGREMTVFSVAKVTAPSLDHGYVYVPLVGTPTRLALEFFAKSESIRAFFISYFISTVALLALLVFALRGVSRSFGSIMDAVSAYAKGAFERRLHVARDDELGALAKVLNDMASSLAEKIRELRHKDELRRELISDVVHDLRGPTGTMRGFIELLQQRPDAAPTEREDYYRSLENGLGHLSALIEQLSQLSRLEVGDAKPVIMSCDALKLAETVVTFQEKRARALGITLRVEHDGEPLRVLCDEDMIRRALTNLIENALRYTDLDGAVVVRLSAQAGKVTFEVEDTGVGIAGADLPHIFERSYQGMHDDPEEKGQGGLGLAIVRKVIEAHGEVVRVSSEKGLGTSFSFALPTA